MHLNHIYLHKPDFRTNIRVIFHKNLMNIDLEHKVTSGSPWRLAALLKLKSKLDV